VLGGSIGSGASDKRYRLCQLARQERVPLVMMLEGAGHRVTDTATGRRPGDLMGLAELSGVVPLVCLVLGASAGHGALTAPLCDFVAMTESASIFAAGPPLVRAATGEDVAKEALGGPTVAIDSGGVVHNLVAGDGEAIDLARRYLAHFPLNPALSLIHILTFRAPVYTPTPTALMRVASPRSEPKPDHKLKYRSGPPCSVPV